MAGFGDIGGIIGSALTGFIGGGAQTQLDDMISKEKNDALALRDQRLAQLQQETYASNRATDLANAGPMERTRLQAQQDVQNDPNNVQAAIDRTNNINTGTSQSAADAAAAKVTAVQTAKDSADQASEIAKGNDAEYLTAVRNLAAANDKPGEAAARNAIAMYNTARANGMPAENALRLAEAYKNIQGSDADKQGATAVKVITADNGSQYAWDQQLGLLGHVVTDRKDPNFGAMQWRDGAGKIVAITQKGQRAPLSDQASSARDAAVAAIAKAGGASAPSTPPPSSQSGANYGNEGRGNGPSIPTVNSNTDYSALQSGQQYYDGQGNLRVKK